MIPERFRDIILPALWGAVWGALIGVWGLAPRFILSHHLHLTTTGRWIAFVLVFTSACAVFGMVCGIFSGFPVTFWRTVTKRDHKDFLPVYGIIIGVLLAPAYLGLGQLIVWIKLGTFVGVPGYATFFKFVVAPYLIFLLLVLLGCRALLTRKWHFRSRFLLIPLVLLAFGGAVTLPYRVAMRSVPHTVAAQQLSPLNGSRQENAPLLIVGIDSGNWRTLQPLLDQGKLPTFAQVASNGMKGTVTALWPPYWSGPAWAAILTGYSREETGVYEDVIAQVASFPGFPALQVPFVSDLVLFPLLTFEYGLIRSGVLRLSPPLRSSLHRPPFWELLSRSGVKVGVVRFWFSYPATGQADVVISDWVGRDSWNFAGVRTDADGGLVFPEHTAEELLAIFANKPQKNPLSLLGCFRKYKRPEI